MLSVKKNYAPLRLREAQAGSHRLWLGSFTLRQWEAMVATKQERMRLTFQDHSNNKVAPESLITCCS